MISAVFGVRLIMLCKDESYQFIVDYFASGQSLNVCESSLMHKNTSYTGDNKGRNITPGVTYIPSLSTVNLQTRRCTYG